MPQRVPRVCGCGKVVAAGTRCPCQVKHHAEAKARHDKRRQSARARGYDTKWDVARKAFLAKHPACAMCGGPANVVDHITPHRGDMKLFWDSSNWQPLCQHHHATRKQRQERGR